MGNVVRCRGVWPVIALCSILALGGFSGQAEAQVAADSLTPFEFVTENPAAMQWGKPSRIGAAYLTQQQVTSPTSVTDNYTGFAGGGRFVGEYFSLAAETSNLTSTNKPYSAAEDANTMGLAGAVGLFDLVSIGYSQQSFRAHTSDPLSSTVFKQNVDSSQVGVSFKFADLFFLGASTGQDTGKLVDSSGTTYINGSRDVNKVGLAVRTGAPAVPPTPGTPPPPGGDLQTHFEYYVIDRSKFSGATAGTTSTENQQTGVIEVGYFNVLFGYRGTHIDRESGFATTDAQSITLGYVPAAGWTFVFIDTQSKDKFPSGSAYTAATATQYTFAVTYLFEAAK